MSDDEFQEPAQSPPDGRSEQITLSGCIAPDEHEQRVDRALLDDEPPVHLHLREPQGWICEACAPGTDINKPRRDIGRAAFAEFMEIARGHRQGQAARSVQRASLRGIEITILSPRRC